MRHWRRRLFQALLKMRAEQGRTAALAAAEDDKRRLQAVMEALPVGVAITDGQGGHVQANNAFDQVWCGPRRGPIL